MKIFSTYHPLTLFVYFLSVVIISMFITNPVMLVTSLVGGMIFFMCLEGIGVFLKNLVYYMFFFILIALTNPLFSHNGMTPLFFLNGNAVTLEAILFGADIALMLVAVIYWFKCLGIVVDSEKLIYIFGKTIPKLSLVMSMTLRFIPMFKRQMKSISNTQKALGYYTSDSYFDRLRSAFRVFSALITWSLENSIEVSCAMKAKGYGLKGRTHFNNFKFTYRDVILFFTTLLMDLIVFIGLSFGKADFSFYPRISPLITDTWAVIVYLSFGIVTVIPAILEIKENLKWKYYVSKI